MVHTIAAIDMALWDITGKLHGVPVYRLLGGPTRDWIRIYPTQKRSKSRRACARRPSIPRTSAKLFAPSKMPVNASVPTAAVMFDAHCMLPPAALIQFANAVESYDLLWIEEPACPCKLEVFKRIKQKCRVPIALGERDRTIWEVIGYLQNGCIDILQFDCGHDGGISQMRKAAAMCESYHVPLAPHCTLSSLGQSASLNTIATMPNFLIHEFYPNDLKGVCKPTWSDQQGFQLHVAAVAGDRMRY